MNQNKINILSIAISLSAMLSISGCASNKPAFASGNVVYGDTSIQETLSNKISSNDFTKLAKSMTDSLLTSSVVRKNSGGNKPTIKIAPVKNKTTEHIDTRTITNEIEIQLTSSEAVEFVSDSVENEQLRMEIQEQTQSGEYKQSKSAKAGQSEGAKYLLTGEITSLVDSNGDFKNIDYIFQLKLTEIETRKKVWAAQDKIRKTSERSTF